MSHIKKQIEYILVTYLAGGVVRNWDQSRDFFESQDELLRLGYDRVGSTEDHSLIENYYSMGGNKGINFKIYFHEEDPWASGVDFFGFRLKSILRLAKNHIRKIDVFFDVNAYDDGALVINEFCVCRFSFMGRKSPRALTFETDISVSASMQNSAIATKSVFKQFSYLKSIGKYKENRNIRKIFEIIDGYHPQPTSGESHPNGQKLPVVYSP